ncbi:type I-E CRISPR-associated protein Cse2/CasB [Deinococcus apachensis]|uniref:type I-E CRISPR-associated protein Cse2/CasB n=1 Tax=Deinococcus apachensis TaxID=309886 RepID=UPI000368277B|nr:type I-E CRISPR-associated protein Cse2/CasB [Deinococcus apachensis]
MTTIPSTATPFERLVLNLSRLDRGQLAQLRRSLGDDTPGQSVPWLEGVFLRSGLDVRHDRQWRALALVAGLYSLIERPDESNEPTPAPEHRPTLGETFGALYLAQEQRPSTEKRFLALLDADMDALPYALRQAVTLLKADGRTPDWVQLLRDVDLWEHPERGARLRRIWAKDFYRTAERVITTDKPTATKTNTPTRPQSSLFDTTVPDEDEGETL